MNREIKFRAWDTKGNGWIYFTLDELASVGYKEDNEDLRAIWNQLTHKTQYTGLKDKNGKEAYHKDKVSALGYSNWIIEWYDNGWKLKQEDTENYKDIPEDFIILGNVYEG